MDSRLQRLTQTYGVFLTREALAVGYEPKTIRALVRRGEWVHVRHGAYCSADLWHSLDARGRRALVADAVYRSAKAHVVLSHTTAVDRMNVPVWDMPDATHLTRTDGKAGRREAGVVQHRGEVVAEDLTLLGGMWVTSGTRTALDCTMIGDTEHSLVIVNGLLHAAETTPELLQRRLDSMVHWPNSLHTELVLRLADSRCESVGETRTFHLCWSEGLPYAGAAVQDPGSFRTSRGSRRLRLAGVRRVPRVRRKGQVRGAAQGRREAFGRGAPREAARGDDLRPDPRRTCQGEQALVRGRST